MTVCADCGGPVDPAALRINHRPGHVDVPDFGCDCPEVCAACCTDPDCPTRTPQETPVDDLLDRIDSWCDDADTGHEYVGRDLLYETWHLVEQVRRERDADAETLRQARETLTAGARSDHELLHLLRVLLLSPAPDEEET